MAAQNTSTTDAVEGFKAGLTASHDQVSAMGSLIATSLDKSSNAATQWASADDATAEEQATQTTAKHEVRFTLRSVREGCCRCSTLGVCVCCNPQSVTEGLASTTKAVRDAQNTASTTIGSVASAGEAACSSVEEAVATGERERECCEGFMAASTHPCCCCLSAAATSSAFVGQLSASTQSHTDSSCTAIEEAMDATREVSAHLAETCDEFVSSTVQGGNAAAAYADSVRTWGANHKSAVHIFANETMQV